jgi:hypothetical protein
VNSVPHNASASCIAPSRSSKKLAIYTGQKS